MRKIHQSFWLRYLQYDFDELYPLSSFAGLFLVGFVYFRDSVYFRCEISADSNPIMLLTAILNIGNGADFTQHQPQPQLSKKGSIAGGKNI